LARIQSACITGNAGTGLCDVIPCSLVGVYRLIGGILRLHFHGRRVKLSLCLIKQYIMKTYGGVYICIDPRIVDLGTNWG
jgi:hypothetical protein